MPRRARMYLPGFPYHIVQRCNNRERCFVEPENYQFYLDLWKTSSRRYGVAVHAYCLMTNHIHFLVTPDNETSISTTMKVVGSRYAQHFNTRNKRTGTLWEDRHRPSLIQTERYLLTCYRYIELNPVRAGMVKRPEEYNWSSYDINAWGKDSWITPHDVYSRLGDTTDDRLYAYRTLFKHQVSDDDINLIRKAAHYCQPVGDDTFRAQIEAKHNIKLGYMKRGRPKKIINGLVNT